MIVTDVSNADRVISVRIGGTPRPEAIIEMLEALNTLVEQNPAFGVLIDETELQPTFVGPSDIGKFVAAWRRGSALRSTRIAVFVRNPAMYGLNRMFQGLAGRDGEGHMNVFTDRAPAAAWLVTPQPRSARP
jgi:hypothetical protein